MTLEYYKNKIEESTTPYEVSQVIIEANSDIEVRDNFKDIVDIAIKKATEERDKEL